MYNISYPHQITLPTPVPIINTHNGLPPLTFRKRRHRSDSNNSSSTSNIIQPQKRDISSYFNTSFPSVNNITEFTDVPRTIILEPQVSIIDIHRIVRDTFVIMLRNKQLLQEKLDELRRKLPTSIPVEQNDIRKQIKEITSKLNDDYEQKWQNYITEALPIFEEYIKVVPPEQLGIITLDDSNNLDDMQTDKENKRKITQILDAYLSIIEKMAIIEEIISNKYAVTNNICPECGNDNSNLEANNDGLYICICGLTTLSTNSNVEFRENNRSSSSTTNSTATFIRWLNRFQGISDDHIPDTVYEQFDQWCIKNGYPTGESVKRQQYPSNFVPNLNMLINIMSETKNSNLYSVKNAIRHHYWGWPLPVLTSEQRQAALERYTSFQSFYDKHKTQPSSINIEIIGYVMLRLIGYPCKLVDFKIPSSTNSIEYANHIIRKYIEEEKIENISINITP